MKKISFLLVIFVSLFFISDVKASVYNANDFEIRVNNTLVMGNDGGGLWDGGYATIYSGNEVNMEIVVNNVGDKAGDNLLVTVTFCSTGTYYGSILTPGYDLTGATLINNYSIQHSNTACKVGGYDGVVMQSIWNLSVPGNSFSLHSWGGIRDNYTVLVDVTGITISDFDPSMAQEFQQYQQNQTIIDQNNQLITGFNNLESTIQDSFDNMTDIIGGKQDQTNDKLDDITNMDIPDESKEDLDDSSYQDYSDAESDLMDSVGQADLSEVDIAIDADSSNFIWDTITDIFESHPLIMSTVIAILSIGIIKLALGR